jgi:predicted peroxiredoxin
MSQMQKKLVVKVLSGLGDPERTAQAFTVAATALASGFEVSLWLTSDASNFALPGKAAEFELPHAAPLQDLLEALLAGGAVTLCTQCAARRGITADQIIPGIAIKGAASFVEEIMVEGVQALIY